MELNPDILNRFQNALEHGTLRKPLQIYDKNAEGPVVECVEHQYTSKDVLLSITKQLDALQTADGTKKLKLENNLIRYKKLKLVPVNLMRSDKNQYECNHCCTNKFETQCVSDTQLINILEDAERVVPPKGMTQEFESSFCEQYIEIKKEMGTKTNYLEMNMNNENIASNFGSFSPNSLRFSETNLCNKNLNEEIVCESNSTEQKRRDNEHTNITESDVIQSKIASSPIIDYIKPLSLKNSLSPLIYTLDAFENFETLAFPIVKTNPDLEAAKHLINSQIIDKELYVGGHKESINNEVERSPSPILSIRQKRYSSNSPKSATDRIKKVALKVPDKNSQPIDMEISKYFEDEILFSSDEDDSKEESHQDLPLTCALETTFYNQHNVLETTMYVGFQTASNKSIQISTESFSKAQSVLKDLDDAAFKLTLTELVEMYDNKNSKLQSNPSYTDNKLELGTSNDQSKVFPCNSRTSFKSQEIDTKTKPFLKETTETKTNKEASMSRRKIKLIDEMVTKVDIKEVHDKENNHFSNSFRILKTYPSNENYAPIFHTASNKRFKLSENSLAKCQHVFKDIDLDDKYGAIVPEDIEINKQIKNISVIQGKHEKRSTCDNLKKSARLHSTTKSHNPREISEQIHLDDQNIIQEFENELIDSDIEVSKVIIDNSKSGEFNNQLKCELTPETIIKKSCLSYNSDILTKQPSVSFKTASNKNIHISEGARMKTKLILNDFNMSQDFEKDHDISNTSKKDIIENSRQNVTRTKVEMTKHLDRQLAQNKVHTSDSSHINRYTESMKHFSLCDFKTANNKSVAISTEALAKSKKFIEDIETNISNNSILHGNEEKKTEFRGFATANNKPIAVTNSTLIKVKNLVKDILNCDVGGNQNSPIEKENDNLGSDFKKVSFKNDVNVSNERSLSASDIDNEAPQKINLQTFQDFLTASNKNVTKSSEAYEKRKKLFHDLEFHKEDEQFDIKEFKGFQTANNKQIKVSSQSLAKSNSLFQDLDLEDTNEKINLKIRKTSSNKPPFNQFEKAVTNKEDINFKLESSQKHMFVGFQTASNKQVKVSGQALTFSKKILQDLELEDINKTIDGKKVPFEQIEKSLTHKENMNSKLEISPKRRFVGFQTASNKQVKVSDQALAFSKKILQHLELEDINKTNGGKKLPFDQIEKSLTHKEIINSKLENSQKCKFVGFQTASNKQVEVSDQALAFSKKILKDLELEDINKINETNDGLKQSFDQVEKVVTHKENINSKLESSQKNRFVGFQPVSNKQVKVSDQALALSKKMLQDLELEEVNKTNDAKIIKEKSALDSYQKTIDYRSANNQNHKLLFKTGNNKDVKVTQEALIESKKILNIKRNDKVIKDLQTIPEQIDTNCEDKINVETLFDSEVLNNFEVTMYTEDFCKDIKPDKSKRSGSPILLCPRAKKRKKFEVPCKKSEIPIHRKTSKTISEQKTTSVFNFDNNYKKHKKYTFEDLKKMEILNYNKRVVDPYIANFNYETSLHFEFSKERNEFSDIKWTTEDLKKYFISQVNNKLIPDGWLDNHLKLVIFKLISYEREFKNTMSGVCSAKNVLEQLKYRYDRELYNVERPIIRKLLENDDVSTKTMILRVIEISAESAKMTSETSASIVRLLLSDGWYCIKACLDQMLVKLVQEQKITVGTKLAINGAELVNCDQGMAPWEDTSRVRLKIFGNSTRRARVDARLGRFPAGAFLTPLSRVQLDGGKVSRVRAFIARVYPMVYVEKFDDGSTVTRSERLEHLYKIKYESDRQALLEKIYEEVEKEFTQKESQDSEYDTQCRGGLDSGSQINRLMRQSKDPAEFRANLTDSQCRLLQDYSSRRREKLLQTVQTRIEERLKSKGLHIGRNVVTVMKVRLADVDGNGGISKAMMSIWRPNDAVQEIIKEGMWIDMFNIVPTAVRFSEIQFSAGRQSIFRRSKYRESSEIQNVIPRLKRTCYTIKDLVQNPTMTNECNEVDTAGFIFLIDPSNSQFESIKGQLFQNVYIADAEKNIVCVNFWGGLKKFGYENVLDTGQVLACVNLQKRAGNTRKSIPQFRATEISYFTKTPKIENARKVVDNLNKSLSGVNIKKFCEECVSKKNSFSVLKYGNGENVSPYRINYSDYNISRHNSYIHSPVTRKMNNLDDILNLSGLDFESTFKQTDTQDMSPSAILRKKKINEKIARLKMYGEPPPITPIHIINKSNNATSAFKNPLSSNNNASYVNEQEQQSCSTHHKSSPVVYSKSSTKRNNGNPVKLNFSHNISREDCNESKIIDPFAEEFDASPPLSLD